MKAKSYYPPVNVASRVLAERAIPYRPLFKQMVGNVNASILLSQITYWWYKKQEQPFYKFAAPSEHKAYKKDDSWQEELGFTRTELDNAHKYIATKIAPKERKDNPLLDCYDGENLAPVNRIVIYWRDRDNVTWYWLNANLMELHLGVSYAHLYSDDPTPANAGFLQPSNVGVLHYPYTETTTEEKEIPATQATQGISLNAKKKNPMYDAIKAVWGYQGAMNGRFAKFLEGRATKTDGNAYFEANVNPPVTPDELLNWHSWYSNSNPDPKFLVKVVAKVQESILQFRETGSTIATNGHSSAPAANGAQHAHLPAQLDPLD